MGTVRNHTRIARSPDDVWKMVSDAGALAEWAPTVDKSSASGNMRHVEFTEGFSLEEEIVTNDDVLRRFQYRVVRYRIAGPDGVTEIPMTGEIFATVDVIDDADGALVIYSTEIAFGDDPAGEASLVEDVKVRSAGFLQGLKEYLER
jgi:carbon monoxide dehydrogenase subunit G